MLGEPLQVLKADEVALERKPTDEKELIIQIFEQRVF